MCKKCIHVRWRIDQRPFVQGAKCCYAGFDLCTLALAAAENKEEESSLTLWCVCVCVCVCVCAYLSPLPARLLASLNMATFPLLFFFSFLYYTDVGAVLCVLLGYALALGRHYTSSAIVSSDFPPPITLVLALGASSVHHLPSDECGLGCVCGWSRWA